MKTLLVGFKFGTLGVLYHVTTFGQHFRSLGVSTAGSNNSAQQQSTT